jgi:hypothetical protein
MRKLKCTNIIGFFFMATLCLAQTPDIFRLEYMNMPRNVSGSKLERIKLVANLPITLKDSSRIIIGGEYNRLSYELQRTGVSEEIEGFRHLHIADFNVAYVHRYNQYWQFIGLVTPRLASTLGEPLGKGDISFNATVGVFKEKKHIEKPFRLVLGIAYNSTVALRVPLPILYYERRFHDHWSYVVGVPKTAMKYHLDKKNMMQAEFILDGYYVNLQNSIMVPGNGSATSISSSAAVFTLGYQYSIKKSMFVYAYAGHTLFQKGVLRDSGRNDIFNLNDDYSFYFRTGFRIGL